MILFIDSGLRGLGASLWEDKKLKVASYVKNPVESGRGYEVHAALAGRTLHEYGHLNDIKRVVIEHPRIYGLKGAQNDGEIDPNDLIDVAAVGAAVGYAFRYKYGCDVVTVFPSEWKGNMPKEKMTARIQAKAESRGDLPRIVKTTKNLMHNVLDAYGIGLWYFDLLNMKVYPGATP